MTSVSGSDPKVSKGSSIDSYWGPSNESVWVASRGR